MRTTRMITSAAAVALCGLAIFASSAAAGEYNLKMLPEIGRCAATERGEYRGPKCTSSRPGKGRFDWRSGPGTSAKFTSTFEATTLTSPGDTITCGAGNGTGEYTGPKSFKETLTFSDCSQSAKSEEEALCQNGVGSTNGEVKFEELEGELGYISHPKRLAVGWDLKPASGSNLASFECGGANSTLGKSLGTGTTRELQGSVIGKVIPIDHMTNEFKISYALARGSVMQSPEHFEGGVNDTLTTLVGTAKTPEPTTMTASDRLVDEEPLEVLAKCKGSGC